MARQVINNGESGLVVRGKINDNFQELYAGKDAVTVANYAALPAANTATGERWWVLASTGVWLVNRRNKGAYYSDGVDWIYLGDFPQAAAEVSFTPVGIISAVNVQAALDELQADVAALGPSTALAGQAIITPTNAFEHVQSVAAVGMTGTKTVVAQIASFVDDDENNAEMLDILAFSAAPGTDTLTFTMAFAIPTNGPIKINWSAF